MKSSWSAAVIVADHEALLIEILKRLPVKALLTFKSVSKNWYYLISSPYFSNLHCQQTVFPLRTSGTILHRYSKSEIHFILFDNVRSHTTVKSLPSPSTPEENHNCTYKPRILQSCNGLFLCSINSIKINATTRTYYIHNPTTNKSSPLLLPSDIFTGGTILVGINLAFNPLKSPHYSVICILNQKVSPYHNQIVTYNSGTETWRKCEDEFSEAPFDMVFTGGVYCNNAIHWISPTGATLCFDLEKERISDKMPKVPRDYRLGTRRFWYFGESGGHLYAIEVYGHCSSEFKVMELQTDYSRWSVKYNVDISGTISAYPQIVKMCADSRSPPMAVPGGDGSSFNSNSYYYAFQVGCIAVLEGYKAGKTTEEQQVLVLRIPGKNIAFSLFDQSFWEIGSLRLKSVIDQDESEMEIDDDQRFSDFEWLDVYPYVETLAYV